MIRSLCKWLFVSLQTRRNGASVLRMSGPGQGEERRWVSRSCLTIRVNLYRDANLVRHTLATDFSLKGMFLRCHQADFKVGDELSLAVPDHRDGTEKWYAVQVKVARIAENGVGMVFHHHDSHLFCCVSNLLHACSDQLLVDRVPQPFPHTHEAA